MLLPFCVTVMIFSEILTPVANGGNVQWNHIWLLWGVGIISALLVFLAAKNDYRKTYIASYQESNATRLRIADHLRKLPMSFFNTKDLSELTTSLKQVKAKLNASDQVQEYLEGMKIIKSCGLSGVHFKSLDNALLATPAMEGKEKEVSNCDIELSHVTFAYNQENVIKDISCKIPQGSVTALVGPSGSGKSIW